MSTAASMRTQTAKPHPGSSSSHAGLLLQRKCACGSTTASLTGECAECKSKKRLQTKLTIGASNDPLEQEADRIADSVIRGEGPVSTRRGIVVGTHVQRHQSATAGRGVPSTVGDVLASRGTPIDAAVQGFMESRLGHDFSRVRIHTGAQASESARAVGASAYTVGNHIVFGDHALDVASESGRRLLAHELVHTIQQSASTPLLQRTCLPSALCPLVSVNLGGGGFNWEAAEVCLQTQYRSQNPGLVGSNKDWKILSGIPGTPEQRDLNCFKSHLAAKSGMFLAQPDIIDFTRAQIYDVTTENQAQAHRVRLWADTGEATALSAIPDCSGASRLWEPGTWIPSPCYALGNDLFMRTWNDNGLLLYQMIKDLSKEAALALTLAVIASQFKNPLSKLAVKVAARNPYVAGAIAAATVIVVLTSDAEVAFAADADPIDGLLKAIENSGGSLPPSIKAAIKSDPQLRARMEAAAKSQGTPSEKAKKATAELLQLIEKNKDQFSREDIEALVAVMEVSGGKTASEAAPTIESLRAQLDRIKKGEIADPAVTAGQTAVASGNEKSPDQPKASPKDAAGSGSDKTPPASGLKAETVAKLKKRPAAVRQLFERMSSKIGEARPMDDATVERFLSLVPDSLTAAQVDRALALLTAGSDKSNEQILADLAKVLQAVQAQLASDLAKQYPKLQSATVAKLVAAPELVRRLFADLTGSAPASAKAIAIDDAFVDRFVAILTGKLEPEQYEAIAQRLGSIKASDSAEKILTDLQKAVATKAKPAPSLAKPDAAKEQGKGKGGSVASTADKKKENKKGTGVGGTDKKTDALSKEETKTKFAETLKALDLSDVAPGHFRVYFTETVQLAEIKGSPQVVVFYGKLDDGRAYLGMCAAMFGDVNEGKTRMTVLNNTVIVDVARGEVFQPDELKGVTYNVTFDVSSGGSQKKP